MSDEILFAEDNDEEIERHGKWKVLIVDDEPLARQRAARLLQELGGIELVGEAANAEQALADAEAAYTAAAKEKGFLN